MTDPENPADGDSSASGSKSKQRLLTRVLTVPGILATTALTATVSWVVSLGLTQLSAAASSPQDAVAVSVEADPTLISGSSNAGRTVVFPAATKTTGDPGVGG